MQRLIPFVMIAAVTSAVLAQQKPAFERAPDALERVTWRTRTLVGDDRLTRWKLAVPDLGLTFMEAVVRADAAVVDYVEATNTQRVSPQIAKPLDYTLSDDDISVLRSRMGSVRVLTYKIDVLPPDAAAQRKVLGFAKALGAETVVVPANTPLAGLDTAADALEINVAVLSDRSRPTALVKALNGKSKRLGLGMDTGRWVEDGIGVADRVAAAKDRLLYLRLRDRSGRGSSARNAPFGQGAGEMAAFFSELDRANVRPLAMTLDTTDLVKVPGDLFTALDAFEAAVQPAYGVHFTRFSKTRPIRWDVVMPAKGETLTPDEEKRRTAEVRAKIDAAIPRQAATPRKPRKLLVIESLHGMSHNTIPHTNVMIQRAGEITGAWSTEFNNDLDLLKYPKIKEYDGIFLNSIVGELLAEPAVREGLARFVREGGGLGGIHGTPWASRNWEEFAEMIGAQSAPHRIEQGVMKVYDASSPIMKPFAGKDIPFREEYYRFEHEGRGRLRWDKVRVLMTVVLDDPAIEPRPWTGYKRPDNIYPVSWIREYGKGHVFYSSLGHMPETFMTPELVGHFVAGIQYLLGDLAADATPNPGRK